MSSSSYTNRNYNSYSYRNNNSSPRYSRNGNYRSASPGAKANQNGAHSSSNNSNPQFICKGTNKQLWSKLCSKIDQKLSSEDISYIEDPEVLAKRKTSPLPPIFLPAPGYPEPTADRDLRQRNQKLIDDQYKRDIHNFDKWNENLAKDFPRAISAVYSFLSQQIVTDLERHIASIKLTTTNSEDHYRAMRKRLTDRWGPNSSQDAEEIRRMLGALHGDLRGWDTYGAGFDELVEVLTKTPIRDASNNPIPEPVPNRPHLPPLSRYATPAQVQQYILEDTNAARIWAAAHPPGNFMNHRPTDTALKNIIHDPHEFNTIQGQPIVRVRRQRRQLRGLPTLLDR